MPRVVFTANLQKHVDCPPSDVAGRTVREVLDAVFTQQPRVRNYVLDEHGAVRKHVIVYINSQIVRDREKLSDPVADDETIYVLQALSGG